MPKVSCCSSDSKLSSIRSDRKKQLGVSKQFRDLCISLIPQMLRYCLINRILLTLFGLFSFNDGKWYPINKCYYIRPSMMGPFCTEHTEFFSDVINIVFRLSQSISFTVGFASCPPMNSLTEIPNVSL